MRILTAIVAIVLLGVVQAQPAAAQVQVGMDPETIRALNEAELGRFVILVGTIISVSVIGTLTYLLLAQQRSANRRAEAAETEQKAESIRWERFYADMRADQLQQTKALVSSTEVNRATAIAIEKQIEAAQRVTERVDEHDRKVADRDQQLMVAVEALRTDVKTGNEHLSKALESGIEKGVSEGIVKAASELRAAFQPLIDEMKQREARNVQEDKRRDTGPLGGGGAGGASADAGGDASGGASDSVSDEHGNAGE